MHEYRQLGAELRHRTLGSALSIVTQAFGYVVAGTSALLARLVPQGNLWLAGVVIAAGASSTVQRACGPGRRRAAAVGRRPSFVGRLVAGRRRPRALSRVGR